MTARFSIWCGDRYSSETLLTEWDFHTHTCNVECGQLVLSATHGEVNVGLMSSQHTDKKTDKQK